MDRELPKVFGGMKLDCDIPLPRRDAETYTNSAGSTSSSIDGWGRRFEQGSVSPQKVVPGTAEVKIVDFIWKRVIGAGHFSKVLLVERNSNNKHYAVKMVRRCNYPKRSWMYEDLVIECKVLRAVAKQPFLMQLHCSFATIDRIFLVMEFVNGGNLSHNSVRYRGKFPRAHVVFYAAELCCAINYLHTQGIVHRDIKPANILLDCEGHVVLTDFGLSLHDAKPHPWVSHTSCGTPRYTAPEIVLKAGHSFPVDWWSLGVVIYEMLSGKVPFEGDDKETIYQNIARNSLQIPADYSTAESNIINGFLEKKPLERLGRDMARLKTEEFFRGIDWVLLEGRKLQPPFVPKVLSDGDISCFQVNAEDTSFCLYSSNACSYILRKERNLNFRNFNELFTYVSPEWEQAV